MNIWLLGLWYLFLLFVVVALQRLTRCFTKLSVITMLCVPLLIQHGIMVPFNLHWNDRLVGGTMPEYVNFRLYGSLVLMYLGLIGGVFLAQSFFGKASFNARKFRAEMSRANFEFGVKPLFFALLIVSVGLVTVLLWRPPEDLLGTFTGSLSREEFRAVRIQYGEAVSSFTGGLLYRIANTIKASLLPMFIFTLFFMRSRGRIYRLAFWLCLFVGLALGILSAAKAPALYLMVGIVIAWLLRHGFVTLHIRQRYLLSAVAFALIMFFGVIPYLYWLEYPQLDYWARVENTIYRLSGETTRTLQLFFYLYPDFYPHTNGLSSSVISALVGMGDVISDPSYVIPRHFIPGYTGTWNSAFIGGAWVDFGWVGVLIESLFVGCLFYGYHIWFVRSRKTAFVLGTYVALMTYAPYLSELNLLTTLLTHGLLLNFIVYLLLNKERQHDVMTKGVVAISPFVADQTRGRDRAIEPR